MARRQGWTTVPLVLTAILNCGDDDHIIAECECVTFEQSTVTVLLQDFDAVDACVDIPGAYPDREFERCSTINEVNLMAPIASAEWLDRPVAPGVWGRSRPAGVAGGT